MGSGAARTELALPDARDRIHPVHARQGLVVAQEALASQVGRAMLQQGGTATDAAVAVGFALAVTLPQAGNLAEAMKRAYADRGEYLGDPDFVAAPVAGLTSKAYAKELAARIDSNRATPAADIQPGQPPRNDSEQTTHYSVADRDGNAVAVTYTLNLAYGSGIVAAGSGILLNNEMDDFAAQPGVPNAYGLTGGAANAIAPGKRPLSSMAPTLVLKDGQPVLVTGSPGGSRIITTVLQLVSNAIDHRMNLAEATVAPRVHHQWLPDEPRVEEGLSPDTVRLLEGLGHRVVVREAMGATQSLLRAPDGWYGFFDTHRPGGMAAGY